MHASVYLMSTWSESQMGVDAWKWTNTQTLISSCGECDATAGNNPKPEQNFKELWASQTTNGCVQPHHSHSHSHWYSYYPTSPPQTPSLLGSRSGRSCRTKGFKLLVETTSSASFEWMATNGWARRRTNRRKEQKRKGWRGWGGCMGMGMMMWMWGQVERRQRRQRLILRFVFALPWASSGCRTHTYTNRHTHTHTHREDVRELCAECQPSNANAGAERRQLENLFNCWQFN